MSLKKQLPIGVSTLEEIISRNLLYVDKTEIIHRLIKNNIRCFLSRPRRFGKSLLISTLKEIFGGNKELFKDLWIGKNSDYVWETRPVIHIDFSEIDSTSLESLIEGLSNRLETIAQQYNISLKAVQSPSTKLSILIRHIAAHSPTKIAFLIDEYDSPLLKHIDDISTALVVRELLKSFYTTVKALDEFIHFTFVTGVTKFSKTSLFSGPNNLDDITLSEEFSALCGYTEQEIITNFTQYLIDCAAIKRTTVDAIMHDIRTWYNGYQMSDYPTDKIYNPYSVLLYLKHKKLKNYWVASGTPTFLVKLIQHQVYDFATIDHEEISSADLDTFDISTKDEENNYQPLPLAMLMLQSGYLTIEKFNERAASDILTYPNQEIRESLNQLVLCTSLTVSNSTADKAKSGLLKALKDKNIGSFCSIFQSLLAHIPHRIHQERESFYHALLHMICILLQINAESEVSVARGNTDMVIQTGSTVYVFEFKLNASPEVALAQIHEKKYYERYSIQHKELFLVGINFDYATKTITYVAEILEQRA
ncbi:MAG: AAA family ATPase [bacterium]